MRESAPPWDSGHGACVVASTERGRAAGRWPDFSGPSLLLSLLVQLGTWVLCFYFPFTPETNIGSDLGVFYIILVYPPFRRFLVFGAFLD